MRILVKFASLLPRSWIRTISNARWRWPWLRRALDLAANQFRNQDGVIQSGVGQGLKFNTGRSNAGYLLGTTEPAIQNVLKTHLQPGMTFWDAGANVGFFSVLAARLVGPEGHVVCFEPLPSNADQIAYNARLNGFDHLIVRREALGRADGQTAFLVTPDPTMGMLANSGFRKPDQATVEEIPITVRSLDRLANEGLPRPDVIKLDVEGVEGEVLAGGSRLLRDLRPILLIELHGTNADVAAELEALDYHSAVVGSDKPVASAPWNAYVIAVPRERADLASKVDAFCAASVDAR